MYLKKEKEGLDYWILVTQLTVERGRWRYACSKWAVFEMAHFICFLFFNKLSNLNKFWDIDGY